MCSHPAHATRERTLRLNDDTRQVETVCDRCGERIGQPRIEEIDQW